jgi:hypothetical protein
MHPLESAWQTVTGEFEAARLKAAEAGRAKVSEDLNQIARRLKQYKTESDWYDAVLDGAAAFSPQAILFAVQGETLLNKGGRGSSLPSELSIALAEAAAFQNAHDSRELVVALRTEKEVSKFLASSVLSERAYIIPISNGPRVAAVLYATAGNTTDVNALELIVNMASSVLERHSQTPAHVQIAAGPSVQAYSPQSKNETARSVQQHPFWSGLPDTDKLLHVRARRFARSKVAEMQLYRPEACRSGLAESNLYLFLKQEIDKSRETFRNQFMAGRPMVDYLHHELLKQLANNDEVSLGADYPGQIV